MLYVIALNARGAAGALMLWRDDVDGELVRIGEQATCDLRLPGAGIATCDVWREQRKWRVRRPDGSAADVSDGDKLLVGQWTVMLLAGEHAAGRAREVVGRDEWSIQARVPPGRRSRPWFEIDGAVLGDVDDELPVMLGGAECCAVRVPWTREAVSALIRYDGRTTRCYPVPGTTLSINGVRVSDAVRLADGDVLALADAPPLKYADADEEIDRLLGLLRGEAPAEPPPAPVPSMPASERASAVVGSRADASLSIWEAALGAAALAAALAHGAITIARW